MEDKSLEQLRKAQAVCTCKWNTFLPLANRKYPCPLHGNEYLSKLERIKQLEQRVQELEWKLEEREE